MARKKLTTEVLIERSKVLYGEALDYSETVYVKSTQRVTFICKVHGAFQQFVGNHYVGGCPKCARLLTNKKISYTTPLFIEKAIAVHGNFYDYSLVDYTGAYNKVKIICPIHGVFLQEANRHLRGCGCQKCSADKCSERCTSNTVEFLEKVARLPDRGYDYSLVQYSDSRKPVQIVCPHHGPFWQTPSSHLKGHGCTACAKSGYDPRKSGYLYILRCGGITKIGITNLSAKERCRAISKSYGSKFEILLFIKFEDGSIPNKVETQLLRELRQQYAPPLVKFEGSSEAFLNVDYEALLSRAVKFIGDVSDSTNIKLP